MLPALSTAVQTTVKEPTVVVTTFAHEVDASPRSTVKPGLNRIIIVMVTSVCRLPLNHPDRAPPRKNGPEETL